MKRAVCVVPIRCSRRGSCKAACMVRCTGAGLELGSTVCVSAMVHCVRVAPLQARVGAGQGFGMRYGGQVPVLYAAQCWPWAGSGPTAGHACPPGAALSSPLPGQLGRYRLSVSRTIAPSLFIWAGRVEGPSGNQHRCCLASGAGGGGGAKPLRPALPLQARGLGFFAGRQTLRCSAMLYSEMRTRGPESAACLRGAVLGSKPVQVY